MDNEQRSDYGSAVIEYHRKLVGDPDDSSEGFASDIITNMLIHLVLTEEIGQEDIHKVLGAAAHNAEAELDEGGKEE